ncbi:MAG: histidine phosphatase family protein [Clostridia bacterium]|nr:histidine phosphatase family protein [Clostridia bacterium]
MKTYRIYLLRHGLTEENTQGRYVGHMDPSLSEEGRKQLVEMKKTMVYPKAQALISSPLKRAIESAKILYPSLNPIEINQFMECNFGEYEGKTAEELEHEDTFPRWLAGDKETAPPGGESSEEFGNRICEGFEKAIDGIFKSGITDTVIMTHGGVIMSLLSRYGLPSLPATSWMTPNGCGYALHINAHLWSIMRKFEIVGELPMEKLDEEE